MKKSMPKYIINADDFGMDESGSRAIIEAFNRKLITSTTMCANGLNYEMACCLARNEGIDDRIGIHLNLTEGIPLTESIKNDPFFCNKNGVFHGKIDRLRHLNKEQKKEVYNELTAQIKRMRASGIMITHADSHHHIHTAIFIAPVMICVLKKAGIRKIRPHRNIGRMRMYKKIGKRIYNLWLRLNDFKTVDYFGSLDDILYSKNRKYNHIYEIMVHPQYDKNNVLIDKTGFDTYPTGRSLSVEINRVGNLRFYSYKEL